MKPPVVVAIAISATCTKCHAEMHTTQLTGGFICPECGSMIELHFTISEPTKPLKADGRGSDTRTRS